MAGRPWTEEEKNFIRNNYKKMNSEEMASILNKSVNPVRSMLNSIGIKRREKNKEFHVGDKFNRLEITEIFLVTNRGKKKRMARCRCDCGKIIDVWVYSIDNGNTKSCGCLNAENIRKTIQDVNIRLGNECHGLSNDRLYVIYRGMIARCYDKNQESYYRYGGRGITVCDEWRQSFQAFYDWANKSGYKDNLTIDRVNTNGNYEPSNCRWATSKEQGNNTSRNHILEAFGETKTMAQWSEDQRCKVPYRVLSDRINKLGWATEEAITTPTQSKFSSRKTPA